MLRVQKSAHKCRGVRENWQENGKNQICANTSMAEEKMLPEYQTECVHKWSLHMPTPGHQSTMCWMYLLTTAYRLFPQKVVLSFHGYKNIQVVPLDESNKECSHCRRSRFLNPYIDEVRCLSLRSTWMTIKIFCFKGTGFSASSKFMLESLSIW